MTGIDVRVLDGVGAEITGVDIAAGLTEGQFDDIRQVFSNEGLIFFRDQSIDEEQHIAFAKRWGDININRFFAANQKYPQIAMVSKEPDQTGNIGGGWHTDHSYDVEPAMGSILVARELPATGGDTWFTNMYKAFECLSPGLQETLLGLNAVHSAKFAFGTKSQYQPEAAEAGRIGNADVADGMDDVVHPVVITHPLSGKRSLYVNPGFTRHFKGWSIEDSAPLLQYLYDVAQKEEFVTKFHWEPGSIAFWDNRATWHLAQNDYHGQRRVMHRITVEGCALGK
ncbi:MAG: TauD/TfdA family dioxygenase [Pseudomonadales bacterium]|jgi:taurine dioxygenase